MDAIFTDVLKQFLSALPNVVGAIVVLLVGWVLARTLSSIVRRVLAGIQIDRIADSLNRIEILEKFNFKIVLSSILAKLTYYMLMLVFIIAATDILNVGTISELVNRFILYIPQLLSALVLFFVGLMAADFIKQIVLTTCRSLGIPSAGLIANFVFYFLFITVTMSALKQAEIETEFMTTNLTIIIGGTVVAFAIGYGLASKEILSSILAAFFYGKGKFQIGDTIQIGSVRGMVVAIDSASVTILQHDKRIIVPLSRLAHEDVIVYDKND